MYERRNHPLLSRAKFARRVARHLAVALTLVAFALGIGVLGYHFLGKLRMGRCTSQCLNDSGRDGTCRSSAFGRGENFCFLLRAVFRAGFHRDRIPHCRAVRTSAIASVSH